MCVIITILIIPTSYSAVFEVYDNRNTSSLSNIENSLYFSEGDNINQYSISFASNNQDFSVSDFPFSIDFETTVSDIVVLNNGFKSIDVDVSVDMFGDSNNFTTLKVYIDSTLIIDKANNKITTQSLTLGTGTITISFVVELDGNVVSTGDPAAFDLTIESTFDNSKSVNYVFSRFGSCNGIAS